VSAGDRPPAIDGELAEWLRSRHCREATLCALAGDVSLRRYFRVGRRDSTAILALYPPDIADALTRFAAVSALFVAAGVRVPRILALAPHLGAMLLEDLGPRTLFDLPRDWPALLPYFRSALQALARLRSIAAERAAELNPPLDAALLERELEKTRDAFLLPRGLLAEGVERSAWDRFAGELARRLAADRPVPCHRDFMARNLVPLPGGEVAVLDHQDWRLGPPAYDLASLLNDSLFPPPEIEQQLLSDAGCESDTDLECYRRAAVQRGFKAVGTFASFALRGSTRHLPLIAPTGARALRHLQSLPERSALPEPLRARLAAAFCNTD
jgi:aminoglycoside/choline kinase family phosphotransferase